MNFPQNQHPHAAQRLEIARQADFCARWLRSQGLEVLCIEKGARTPPRITIRSSSRRWTTGRWP